MPHEEKEPKHEHKFKPVIEEIVDEQPQPVNVAEALAEVTEEPRKIDHPVHTYPTTDENAPVKDERDRSQGGFHLNMSFVFITVAVAIFVAIISGALYVYFNGVNSIKIAASPTPDPGDILTAPPTPTSSSTPSPSPVASATPSSKPVALDTYKISILNGSGRIGEAGKAKTLLETAGFKVTKTGNADTFNYPETLLQVKQSVATEAVSKAQEALGGTYTVKVGNMLDSKSAYDIIVTIGAK